MEEITREAYETRAHKRDMEFARLWARVIVFVVIVAFGLPTACSIHQANNPAPQPAVEVTK